MKKTLSTWMLALVLVTGAFVSCSKDGATPTQPPGGGNGGVDTTTPPPASTYYLKMKIDGVSQSFTNNGAISETEEEGYVLIIGGTKNENASEEFDLVLSALSPLGAGEYTEGEHENYLLWGVYAPEDAEAEDYFYSGFTATPQTPLRVNISQITDKVVKGTFSGSFYDNDGEGPNKKVITDGQFYVKIQD